MGMGKMQPTGWKPPKLDAPHHQYPRLNDPNSPLPPCFSVCLVAGPRASGKTRLIASVIRSQERIGYTEPGTGERCKVRTIIISPTWEANQALHSLRSVEAVHDSCSPAPFESIVDEIKEENARYRDYRRALESRKAKRRKPRKTNLMFDSHEEQEEEELEVVEPPVWNLVIDDMVGSSLFKQGSNPFLTYLCRNRHARTNIWLALQGLKVVPKVCRANASVLCFFRFGSRQIVADMQEEVAGNLSEERFLQLYQEATKEDHGALCCDFSKPKGRRYTRSFEEYLG